MANQGYIRYSDTAGIQTSPQPSSIPGTVDPGAGWTTQPYLNFSDDYVRYSDTAGITTAPQPLQNAGDYVRHDENNNVGIVSSYVRHDDNNQPV